MSKEVEGEILRILNGSRLYGLHTPESDHDYLSVFVENPDQVFTAVNPDRTIKLHDRGANERNVDAEDDGVAYGLRHFFKLLKSGNPTLLCVPFAPPDAIITDSSGAQLIFENRQLFLHSGCSARFYGYATKQKERMARERAGHTPNRPEIVEKYGYDCKYAMHIVRLALQGEEILSTGNISLPMREEDRTLCLDVRHGKYTEQEALDMIEEMLVRIDTAGKNSDLPPEPDHAAVAALSRQIHEGYWQEKGI